MRVELEHGAFVVHEPSFLAREEATTLLDALLEELPWEQRDVVLFGKRVPQPRLVAWAGALPYRYSGQTLPPRAPCPTLALLMRRVGERAGAPFNHVLANRYRSGADGMGMHSDDEPELGLDPVVATLSLGATRRFVIVPRRGRSAARLDLSLEHGSLLVMGGTCQTHYRHGVPKTQVAVGTRVSLTFRNVLRAPEGRE